MPAPTCALPPPDPRSLHDDDVELELPPLDGGLDDAAPPADADDIDEAPALPDDDGGALEIDPVAELDAVDDAPGDGAEAAREALDVGSLADAIDLPDAGPVDPGRSAPLRAGERGLAHDALEDDASLFDAPVAGDPGSGTDDDLGGFIDEAALPPLGEDDAPGEHPSSALPAQGGAPPWDRGRYRLAAGLGAEVPCGAVAVSAACVVAAGPAVLVVIDGARVSRGSGPGIDAVALAATEATVFAASRGGELLASPDGGVSWVAASAPDPPSPAPIALAATPGRLWIGRGGELWSQRHSGRGPEPLRLVRAGGVRAMAAAGTSLVTLEERSGELVLERLRGDDEPSAPQPLPPGVSASLDGGAPSLAAAAGGGALALISGSAAHVSRDGGASFTRHVVGPVLAAAFAGTSADAPVMVLVRGARATAPAELIEIDARGACLRVADVPGASGGAASLAWDPGRDVLWLASADGLFAFERAPRH